MADRPPTDVRVRVRRDGDETIIAVAGEVDLEGAPALRDALAAAVARGTGDVIVDLSGVTLLDSTALATLLNALRRLRRGGRELAVARPSPHVAKVLRLARLEGDLGAYATVEEALARRR